MSVKTPERFEREYFERNYRDYVRQTPERKLAFYRGLVERAAAAERKPCILELGCAFGRFLASLDPRWRRFGLDVSEYAIGQARAAVPEATFMVADGSEIPLENSFHVIAAFDVIEHMADLQRLALTVAEHLNPGGHWIFVVPVYDGPTGPIIRLLDKDPTHIHKRSRRFWLDWAATHFELVDWCGMYRYLLPGGYYLHLVMRRLRWATPAIAVVAGRP